MSRQDSKVSLGELNFRHPNNEIADTRFCALGGSRERSSLSQGWAWLICEVKHGKLMRLGLLPLGMLLCGCAFKEPTIIYKEKLTPVRCNAVMPDKPNNDGSFEAHKAKMIYFLKCEDLLKQCIGIADGK